MKLKYTIHLFTAAASLIASGCVEQMSAPASVAPTDSNGVSSANSSTMTEPEVAEFRKLPGMNCMVNKFGVRRKAIIARRNVRATNVPNGEAVGLPLRYFFPYYIFDIHETEGELSHVQIGITPRTDSVVGWVRASDCQIWDHRMAARRVDLIPKARIPPLLIYESKDSLIEMLKKGETDDKPIARASFSSSPRKSWMPWPIVDVDRIEIDGSIHELYRLAFLGEVKSGGEITQSDLETAGKTAYSKEEIENIRQNIKMLDVAFVIDATGSMQKYFDAVKQTVAHMAEQLDSFDTQPSLAFSLTAYRDHDRESRFATRHFDLKTNASAFIKLMNQAKVMGGGDPTEAVYDGIWDSLNKTTWRGEGLSARVIILIGDCPAHEAGSPQNPRSITARQLIERANQSGVKIFGLAVGSKDGNSVYRLRWRQFSRLAKGTGGSCVSIHDADSVVKRIRSILNTEAAVVHKRAFVAGQLKEGKTKEQIVAENVVDIREFTEVMEFFGRAGIDAEKLRGNPTFATGWCLAAPGGVSILKKEIFIARSELEVLTSELNRLCVSLDANFGHNIAEVGLLSRVDPRSWFSQQKGGPLDIWLAKQGIPTSKGILKLTRTDIDHMPEEQRGRLREDIMRHYLPRLVNLRNDDSIFAPIDDLEWGFVDEENLP